MKAIRQKTIGELVNSGDAEAIYIFRQLTMPTNVIGGGGIGRGIVPSEAKNLSLYEAKVLLGMGHQDHVAECEPVLSCIESLREYTKEFAIPEKGTPEYDQLIRNFCWAMNRFRL